MDIIRFSAFICKVKRNAEQRVFSEEEKKLMPPDKLSLGELRLIGDLEGLNRIHAVEISFLYDSNFPMDFEVSLYPDTGYYEDGTFVFHFRIPPLFPYEPPKVKCKTKVFHPNIDLEGNVNLGLLGEDWRPVHEIASVIRGIHYLFRHPDPDKPLNHEAAAMLKDNPKQFESYVRKGISELHRHLSHDACSVQRLQSSSISHY